MTLKEKVKKGNNPANFVKKAFLITTLGILYPNFKTVVAALTNLLLIILTIIYNYIITTLEIRILSSGFPRLVTRNTARDYLNVCEAIKGTKCHFPQIYRFHCSSL